MKVASVLVVIILVWLSPALAQTPENSAPARSQETRDYSVPPLPPSVKPITADSPAGPAEPRPRPVPPPASNEFDPPPEAAEYGPAAPTPEEIEATLEAVDPSWRLERKGEELWEAEVPAATEVQKADEEMQAAEEIQAVEQIQAVEEVQSEAEEDRIAGFEELLSEKEGVEFEYEGATYVWKDGQPFEITPDGALMAVTPPEDLYVVEDDGRKWLSRTADGNVYINVAPSIWATINFAHNSDVIEDDSRPVLDVFGESLNSQALRRHRLIIAGHTSRTGNAEYNVKLSRRRALSVSRYLIEHHGIEPDRLILHGYGFERPIADNETEEGQALNRRVEFILLGPGSAE